jgi:hypothetical protein
VVGYTKLAFQVKKQKKTKYKTKFNNVCGFSKNVIQRNKNRVFFFLNKIIINKLAVSSCF